MNTNARNFFMLMLSIFMLISVSNAQESVQSFKVAGTCGMCKKKIEETAIKNGASKAEWSKQDKSLQIYFDPSKTSEDQIKKAIADAGYDNDSYKASDEAYNGLHECCKYERDGTGHHSEKSCSSKKQCKKTKSCSSQSKADKCEREKSEKTCKKDGQGKSKSCCKKD
jgi:mercuric ion binding protein